ncbi:osteocalcin 2-like [Drosophila obscura]|uniref:osteocalcin 2-like n=1 Tax=Drosophila obscura TaxID=7282 RepID=UPI001BB2BCEA|nr:osteocalcin 2-like [Drosophila obscura]
MMIARPERPSLAGGSHTYARCALPTFNCLSSEPLPALRHAMPRHATLRCSAMSLSLLTPPPPPLPLPVFPIGSDSVSSARVFIQLAGYKLYIYLFLVAGYVLNAVLHCFGQSGSYKLPDSTRSANQPPNLTVLSGTGSITATSSSSTPIARQSKSGSALSQALYVSHAAAGSSGGGNGGGNGAASSSSSTENSDLMIRLRESIKQKEEFLKSPVPTTISSSSSSSTNTPGTNGNQAQSSPAQQQQQNSSSKRHSSISISISFPHTLRRELQQVLQLPHRHVVAIRCS